MNKIENSSKGNAETVGLMRAELNAKILKRLSKPIVLGEKAILSSLLADPAALTRLVRHVGLSSALNQALELEVAQSGHPNSHHIALLQMELARLFTKAKPIAFGGGEPYGANLELDKSKPHGSTYPEFAKLPDDFNFGVATRYAPDSNDYDNTIDYLSEGKHEEFSGPNHNFSGNWNFDQPNKNFSVRSISVMLALLIAIFAIIYALLT